MTIKHTPETKTIRLATAKYEHMVGEELTVSDVRVFYASPTIADLERSKATMEETGDALAWMAEDLAGRVTSMPDIVDAKNMPVKITTTFFKTMSVRNLQAIQEGINVDLYPKSEGAKSTDG